MLRVLIRSALGRLGASNESQQRMFYGEFVKIIPELSSNTPP